MKKLTLFLVFSCLAFAAFSQQAQLVMNKNDNSKTKHSSNILFGNISYSNIEIVNSFDLDYSPVRYKDGIAFTSTRGFEDSKKRFLKNWKKQYSYIFYAKKKKNGTYDKPEPLKGDLNSRYHESSPSFSIDGTKMYFTRNSNQGKNEFGKVDLKIYEATLIRGHWKYVKEIKVLNNENHTSCHPTISKDGKKLYFASNKYGGYGGMDIYVSRLENGEWQLPENLGETVNSDGNETFPYIDQDRNLFFSSDGQGGAGGMDIFVTNSNGSEIEIWNKPRNVGTPFNSEGDDFGFTCDSSYQSGFFTSSRNGGKGKDDIYVWNRDYMPQAKLNLKEKIKSSIIKRSSEKISEMYESSNSADMGR